MNYLVTSREGLYALSLSDDWNAHSNPSAYEWSLLSHGLYFGVAFAFAFSSNRWYVFRCDAESLLPNSDAIDEWPSDGVIESFVLSPDGKRALDWRVEVGGLDNGSHQLVASEDGTRLWLLETYAQRLRVFRVDPADGKLSPDKVAHPMNPGRNIATSTYVLKGLPGTTCQGYLHMNAIAFKDGLAYLSCPRLRDSAAPGATATHSMRPHCILAFDPASDPEFLSPVRTYQLPEGDKFCHDLVFVGDVLHATSPSSEGTAYGTLEGTPKDVLNYDIMTGASQVHSPMPRFS